MKKTTLKKMSRKELINIATENGIKNPIEITSSNLIEMLTSTKKHSISLENENLEVKGASKKFETISKDNFLEPEYPDETRNLPEGYGDTRIVAMVRDPYWAFAYWEISHERKKELGILDTNNYKMILRVYDITDLDFNGLNAHSHFDIEINNYTNNWYIQIPSPNKNYCIDIGINDGNDVFKLIARSNVIKMPRDSVSDQVDNDWKSLNEELFNEFYRISGGYKVNEWSGSEMITKLLGQNPSSGSVASSSMRPVKSEAKDFWLVVNTELIVYGATESDANVSIQGHKIKLRPDGTFSARFALPDGEQIIPVHAVNKDGDMEKQITPIVNKKTRIDIE